MDSATEEVNPSLLKITWRLQPHVEKLLGHKWKKVIPSAWRDAAYDLAITYGAGLLALGLAYFACVKGSAESGCVVVTMGILFWKNFRWLAGAVVWPNETGVGSRELLLLARRFRRAAYRLSLDPVGIGGMSQRQAAAYEIMNWFLGGEFGLVYIREAAFRLDLLIFTARILTLLVALVFFFGALYWHLVDVLTFRESYLYALGTLATVDLVFLQHTLTVQNLGAMQVVIQILILVLILPLVFGLHERDTVMNESAMQIARRLSSELKMLIRKSGLQP